MLGFWRVPIRKNCMAWGKIETLFGAMYPAPPRHRSLSSIRATQIQRSLRANTQVQYRSQDPWGPPWDLLGSSDPWDRGAFCYFGCSHFPTSACLLS